MNAVQRLLTHVNGNDGDGSIDARVLWTMSFTSHSLRTNNAKGSTAQTDGPGLTVLKAAHFGPSVDDAILDAVRPVWRDITKFESEDSLFLRFEDREEEINDDLEA